MCLADYFVLHYVCEVCSHYVLDSIHFHYCIIFHWMSMPHYWSVLVSISIWIVSSLTLSWIVGYEHSCVCVKIFLLEICLKMELVNRTYEYPTLVYNVCCPKWFYYFRTHRQCVRILGVPHSRLSITSLILAIPTGWGVDIFLWFNSHFPDVS